MTTRAIAHRDGVHAASSAQPTIVWAPWSGEAFARAALEHKPVLLSITAAWCRACREMDATTYANADVIALVRDRFVAVRVDSDRRPDVNDRYNLGGWPTTAFLTADGDVLGGGTFVTAERMPRVLDQVIEALATRASEIARARTEPREQAESIDASDSDILDSVFATYDERDGGFGLEPKFPLAAPVQLALALFRDTGDRRWRSIVERTLDAMIDSPLLDPEDGGFYRYAAARNWREPHREKLLDTNASLLRVFAEAGTELRNDRYLETAAALVSFIKTLACRDGYRGSDADATVYTDSSAAASAALLAASAALHDTSVGQEALEALERVLLASYRPGSGLAHYVDGEPQFRGWLADQVAAVHALLDAQEAAGGEPYGMMAEELAHYMVRLLWDEVGAGFLDRPPEDDDVGLFRSPRKPLVVNCEAARALARLEPASGGPDFRARALATLRSASCEAVRQGPLAAHYLLARRELMNV